MGQLWLKTRLLGVVRQLGMRNDGLAYKQDIHAGRGDGLQVANGGIMGSVLMLNQLIG